MVRCCVVISLLLINICFFFSEALQGKPNTAQNQYTSSSAQKIGYAQILSQGLSYYYQKKDKLAIQFFNKYLDLHGKSVIALRYLGIIYFRKGNLLRAITYLKKAAEFDPKDLQTLQILGQTNLSLGKLEEAKTTYEQILKINPLYVNALEVLAKIYEKQKNKRKSISYYKRLLIASRKKFSSEGISHALQTLGGYYYDQKKYVKATKYYEKLNQFDHNNTHSVYALAHLYKLQGKIHKSTKQYLNVLKNRPKHQVSRYELIDNYYLTNNSKAKVEAKRFSDDFVKPPALIKGIYAELSNKTEKAEYQFRFVLNKQPSTLSAHMGMSKIYIKLKDYENLKKETFLIVYLANQRKAFFLSKRYALLALNMLDKEAEELGFNPALLSLNKRSKIKLLDKEIKELIKNYIDIYSAHAFTMDQLNEVRSGVVYYKKSLVFLRFLKKLESNNKSLLKQLKKKEYELLTNLGWLLHLKPMKEYDQSIWMLAQGIHLFPKKPQANFLTGIVYYNRGNDLNKKYYNSSVQYLKKAIHFTPNKNAPSSYFFYLGASMEKNNHFKAAEKLLKKAIILDPENSSYKNYLGYIYSIKGIKYPEANELLLSALEDEPENAAYLDSLGWLLYKRGRYSQALEQLLLAVQQAEKKENVDPVIYFHIAEIYHKLNKHSLASDYFLRTLKAKKITPKEMISEKIDVSYIKKQISLLKKERKP